MIWPVTPPAAEKSRRSMNNDLISRSALLEKIESTAWYHISESGNLAEGANSKLHTPLFKADDIFSTVKNAPAVDAVEVVRCKDCTFCKPSAAPGRFFCDWHRDYFETFPDDFCSHGERKADE